MPIFEYRCAKCGKISEFMQSHKSKAAKSCPHCGSKKLEKQLSGFAIGISRSGSKKCYGCSDNKCPHSQN